MGSSERVLVAMSGGVDSAVAAALIAESGRSPVGVTLHLWDAEGPARVGRCCAPEDRDDARRVADHLGIPHYVFDEREAFRREVVDPFVASYRRGETPSPCVHCNRATKLAALARIADGFGISRVATGHYARVLRGPGGPRLLRGVDRAKDQSYFLFGVDRELLARLELPLGGLSKDEARAHARRLGLHVAEKRDSQELCFVPDGDVSGFLAARGGGGPAGPILDEGGRVLGAHAGVGGFTVGQRRGLGLGGGGARYVLRVLADEGAVVVGPEEALRAREVTVREVRWRPGEWPSAGSEAAVRIRYRHEPARAVLYPDGEALRAVFAEPQRAVTPGQAAVVYRGEEVLGGGFIVG